MMPASSITTSAPASVSTLAAIPPPAPEPTTQTSNTLRLRMICIGHLIRFVGRLFEPPSGRAEAPPYIASPCH